MKYKIFNLFIITIMCVMGFISTSCSEDPFEDLNPPVQETPVTPPEDPEPEPNPEPEPDTPDEPTISSDSVMVSLALSSLEWDVSPMSRASNDDLYGFIVYQSKDSLGQSPTTQVATGLYDNPNLITMKLAKEQFYHFVMIYMPNGKNLVESAGPGKWYEPFAISWDDGAVPELNTVVYKRAYNTVGFVDHNTFPVGGTRATIMNTVLRYHGVCANFKPDDSNNKASIKLYRWQYGVRITITDFYQGSVVMRPCDNTGAKVVIESNSTGTSVLECNLQFPIYNRGGDMLRYGDAGLFAEEYDNFVEGVEIVYVTPENEEILLWTSGYLDYPFKRMRMHSLEFSLSGAITNGGLQPELVETEDTPMEEVEWNW